MARCKLFYLSALPIRTPTAVLQWNFKGYDHGEQWRKIHNLPYETTQSTKLQSLQYRIIHRFFPTRRYLHVIGIVDSPNCTECGGREDLAHLFFNCSHVRAFWTMIAECLDRRLRLEDRFPLNERAILFGSLQSSKLVNLFILVAKQFIVYRKYKELPLKKEAFFMMVRKTYEIEKYNAIGKERIEQFKERWKPFIDSQLNLSFV